MKALIANGINGKRRIVGTKAPTPFLYNLPPGHIERFRAQLTFIDLQFESDPDAMRKAVWSCYQESPVDFRGRPLSDPGAFPEAPLDGGITWRIAQPWAEPSDDGEREALKRAQELMRKLGGKI